MCSVEMNGNITFHIVIMNSKSMFCYLSFKSSASFTCVGEATGALEHINRIFSFTRYHTSDSGTLSRVRMSERRCFVCTFTLPTPPTLGELHLGNVKVWLQPHVPKDWQSLLNDPTGGCETLLLVWGLCPRYFVIVLSMSLPTPEILDSVFLFNLFLLKHLSETLKTYTSFLYF